MPDILGAIRSAAGTPVIVFTRGNWWPGPWLNPFTGETNGGLDPWAAFRDTCCEGCGMLWADLPPGHSWSNQGGGRGRCWNAEAPEVAGD